MNNSKKAGLKRRRTAAPVRLPIFSAAGGRWDRTGPLTAALLCALALLAAPAQAAAQSPFHIESRQAIKDLPAPAGATLALVLTLADLAQWPADDMTSALRSAASILGQCGVAVRHAELLRVQAPPDFRWFDTPRSRELARALDLPRPTLYFTAGTRQRPAFDAEAVGRGNSRTRPELADSVWVAPGARDLGQVLAHELAHVLMDSGAHDATPGNLMAAETRPGATQLTAAQCTQLRATGSANGLLQPLH